MRLGASLALRYAWARKSRSLVTLVGVMAGVAGLRAIELGTRGALDSVRAAFEEAAGPAALVVTPAGESSAPLPPGALGKLEAQPGVTAVLPLVQVPTVRAEELNVWAAPLVPGEATGVLVVGVDQAKEKGRGRWHLAAGGELEAGKVLLGARWAEERKLAPGQAVRLVAGDGVARLPIAGWVAREGLGAKSYGQVVIAPIDEVRRAFSLAPDEVHEAALVLAPDAQLDEVASHLRAALGPGVRCFAPESAGRTSPSASGTSAPGRI